MPKDLKAIMEEHKKINGRDELEKIKRQKDIEREMESLCLSDSEYKEFLEKRDDYKPTLYMVNELLDDTTTGEYKVRMSTFVSFILAKNPTYLSGPSSSGKSQILNSVMDTVMPGDIITINGSSEHALIEKSKEINKAKYAIILEFNKITSDINREIVKSWGEGVDYLYSRSKIQGGCQDIILKCLPVAITRADESEKTCPLGVELASRLTELTVNSSQEQTLAVMSRQAEMFEDPFTTKYVNKVDRTCLKWHISNLPSVDYSINPASQMLKNAIPSVFSTARRQFPSFKYAADGICLFNWKDRIIGNINDKSVIFVTVEDNFLNSLIFGDTLKDAALRLNDLQKTIMTILLENKGGLNKQEVQQKLRTYSLNNTINIVSTHLDHLVNLGYVSSSLEGRVNYYYPTDFYKNFDLTPDFREILKYTIKSMESKPHYAAYVDEYVDRFCDPNNLKTISPFSGEEIDILNYKWDSVFKVSEECTRINHTDNPSICTKSKSISLTDFM